MALEILSVSGQCIYLFNFYTILFYFTIFLLSSMNENDLRGNDKLNNSYTFLSVFCLFHTACEYHTKNSIQDV